MRELNKFIEKMEVADLPLLYGRKFTRFNSQEDESWSKLDRFFVDREWHLNFLKNLIQWGQRSLSKHCPILLTHAERNWGPKPFQFVGAWFNHPSFEDVVDTFGNLSKFKVVMDSN